MRTQRSDGLFLTAPRPKKDRKFCDYHDVHDFMDSQKYLCKCLSKKRAASALCSSINILRTFLMTVLHVRERCIPQQYFSTGDAKIRLETEM